MEERKNRSKDQQENVKEILANNHPHHKRDHKAHNKRCVEEVAGAFLASGENYQLLYFVPVPSGHEPEHISFALQFD
jgi:hypothetical protein